MMTIQFSEETPVYAKPKPGAQPATAAAASSNYRTTVYSGAGGGSVELGQGMSTPYPMSGGAFPTPLYPQPQNNPATQNR